MRLDELMTANRRLSASFVLALGLAPFCCAQQQQQPEQAPPPTDTALATLPTPVVKQQKPPEEPYIIEDGGFSIEPMYWLNRAQPVLRGGADSTSYAGSTFSGNADPSILGGEISAPLGHSDTLRLSYFRAQGNGDATVPEAAFIFSESYNAGDYLVENYLIQSAKLSWEYLSYTWYKPTHKIRFDTLYEAQFVSVSSNYYAPYVAVTTDSSGNVNYNNTSGSKSLIYPSFGGELEEQFGRHFRWEVKASGFGIPHHGDIWDTQGDIVLRAHNFELSIGERAFHFKTSPQADEYFVDTLSGAYVGLRYYWGSRPE